MAAPTQTPPTTEEKPKETGTPPNTVGDNNDTGVPSPAKVAPDAAQPATEANTQSAPYRPYLVKHSLVGEWSEGTVIDGSKLTPEQRKRLVRLGAIERYVQPITEDEEIA